MFPLFVDIENKKCIIIGAGNVAYRKISTLLKYNADITVISPEICENIQNLYTKNRLKVIKRNYKNGDLKDAFMVIACACEAVNLAVFEEIKLKNIYFNCSKPSDLSNFNFPSIIKKGKLNIGISTAGSYPLLASAIRKEIEGTLPENIDIYLELLSKFRLKVIREVESDKRKFILNEALKLLDFNIEANDYERTILKVLEEFKDEDQNRN